MTLYRWTALARESRGQRVRRSGETAGESAASVRASLRRLGLQVTALEPMASRLPRERSPLAGWQAHLRRRRKAARGELYDGLATMLQTGIPLLEALDTVVRGLGIGQHELRRTLMQVREDVRSGKSLGQAMRLHPNWFPVDEMAIVEAAQVGGNLAQVLAMLAERHERAGDLEQKLTGALAYPVIVTIVGCGVLVFLSTKTLPDLVKVLRDAKVEPPRLTAAVMGVGQWLAANLAGLAIGALFAVVIALLVPRAARALGLKLPAWVTRLTPVLRRRLIVAHFASRLADLLKGGVALVDAVRVLAPTVPATFASRVKLMAERIERGEEFSATLDDAHWFAPELRRLVEVGEASGELEKVLARLAERTERQARRLIERLATLLEPAVILALAALIGVMVMAAVLPIVRLQEVL